MDRAGRQHGCRYSSPRESEPATYCLSPDEIARLSCFAASARQACSAVRLERTWIDTSHSDRPGPADPRRRVQRPIPVLSGTRGWSSGHNAWSAGPGCTQRGMVEGLSRGHVQAARRCCRICQMPTARPVKSGRVSSATERVTDRAADRAVLRDALATIATGIDALADPKRAEGVRIAVPGARTNGAPVPGLRDVARRATTPRGTVTFATACAFSWTRRELARNSN